MFLTKNRLNKSGKSPWQLRREATGFQICQQLSPKLGEKSEKAFKWKISHVNSGEWTPERQEMIQVIGIYAILAKWAWKCNISLQGIQRVFFNVLPLLLHTSALLSDFVLLGQSSFFPSCRSKFYARKYSPVCKRCVEAFSLQSSKATSVRSS